MGFDVSFLDDFFDVLHLQSSPMSPVSSGGGFILLDRVEVERQTGEKLLNFFFFAMRTGKYLSLELFCLRSMSDCKHLTHMENIFWIKHKLIHWQGPNPEKLFQGTLKEINVGTLVKELNGKEA